jgi:hypothetical protein
MGGHALRCACLKAADPRKADLEGRFYAAFAARLAAAPTGARGARWM